jgi:hypothetical protein
VSQTFEETNARYFFLCSIKFSREREKALSFCVKMSSVPVPFLVSLNNNNNNNNNNRDSLILHLRGGVGTGRRCGDALSSSSFVSSRATTCVVRGLSKSGQRRRKLETRSATRNGAKKKKERTDEREEKDDDSFFVKPAKPESFATRKSRFEAYLSLGGEETTTTKKKKKKKKRRCEVCKGKAKVACEGCNGYGWLNEAERIKKSKRGDLKSWHPSWCGHCRGSGAMGCARCFGSGEFRQQIGFRLFGDDEDDEEEEEVDDSFDEDE